MVENSITSTINSFDIIIYNTIKVINFCCLYNINLINNTIITRNELIGIRNYNSINSYDSNTITEEITIKR